MPESLKLHSLTAKIIICFIFIINSGCGYENQYYNEMKLLSEKIESDPEEIDSWNKLIDFTNSPSFWNKHYAYTFLADLRIKGYNNEELNIDSIFIKGLQSSDIDIMKLCFHPIEVLGEPLISQALPTLKDILYKETRYELLLGAVLAISNLNDYSEAKEIIKRLSVIANKPQSKDIQDEAPQIRYFALESAKKLILKHKIFDSKTIQSIENLLNTDNDYYRKKINKVLSEIKIAQQHDSD